MRSSHTVYGHSLLTKFASLIADLLDFCCESLYNIIYIRGRPCCQHLCVVHWLHPGVLCAVPDVIEINKMLRFFSHLNPDSLLKFFHVFVHSLTFWVASLYSDSFSVLPPEICWHFRVLILKRRLLFSY